MDLQHVFHKREAVSPLSVSSYTKQMQDVPTSPKLLSIPPNFKKRKSSMSNHPKPQSPQTSHSQVLCMGNSYQQRMSPTPQPCKSPTANEQKRLVIRDIASANLSQNPNTLRSMNQEHKGSNVHVLELAAKEERDRQALSKSHALNS
jgi:hypothetical protein